MKNFKDHIIHHKASIREALNQITNLEQTLTLIVVNDKSQLHGTLTDGDIRRGFVMGNDLSDNVDKFMTKTFHFLKNEIDVKQIQKLKLGGIGLLPVVNDKKEITKVYNLQKLNSVLPLDAIIMAGGKGERLKPLTDSVPKPMLKIGNKPIIEHNIDWLISYGIETIYISVNYLKEQIIDYFGNGEKKGVEIKYIEEGKPLGTAGSLSLIDNLNRDIIVTNSDLFTNINYEDFYLAFHNQNAEMAIASVPYTVNIPYAILEEEQNIVKRFKEKPINTHYANAGIYLLNKELLNEIPKNSFYNMTDLMQATIDSNKKIIHNPLIGYWIDIGKKEDLEKAKEVAKHLI
jgi:dTDP-glucose pyrophosphorylase